MYLSFLTLGTGVRTEAIAAGSMQLHSLVGQPKLKGLMITGLKLWCA